MTVRPLSVLPVLPVLLLSAAIGGCAADKAESTSAPAITLTTDDSTCRLSQTQLIAGESTFAITNEGSQVTEVYVYQGSRVVAEKEDIGPGTSHDMSVQLDAGSYEIACKPGMTGDGIRTPITVTG